MSSDALNFVTNDMLISVTNQMQTQAKTLINAHKAHVDYHLKQIEANQEYHMKRIEAKLETAQVGFLEGAKSQIENGQAKLTQLLEGAHAKFEGGNASAQFSDVNRKLEHEAFRKCLSSEQESVLKSSLQDHTSRMVSRLRQDLEEALAKHAAEQCDMRLQLTAMQKDVEVQSQNITVSVGQISKISGELLDFKQEVQDMKSKSIERHLSQVSALQEATEVHSQGQMADLAAQLSDLRREVEDWRSKNAEGKMSNLVEQLLELRRDVKDVQSKQTEGRLSEVSSLQKDMKAHSANSAGQMSNLAAQLLDLRREVEDLQSKNDTEADSQNAAGQISNLAAQLLDLRREVEDLQTKQKEGPSAADRKNELAVEALASLQSRLKGASSVIVPASSQKLDERSQGFGSLRR